MGESRGRVLRCRVLRCVAQVKCMFQTCNNLRHRTLRHVAVLEMTPNDILENANDLHAFSYSRGKGYFFTEKFPIDS